MRDPLELFNDLPPVTSDGKFRRVAPDDEPDYPGGTPPRNRGERRHRPLDDRFNGARSKTYKVNGEEREFFTIGELARALGRKPVTIRMWEQRGWIPLANYRTPPPSQGIPGKANKGRRLYSREQVEFLIALVQAYNLDSPRADWDGFKKHVAQSWPT